MFGFTNSLKFVNKLNLCVGFELGAYVCRFLCFLFYNLVNSLLYETYILELPKVNVGTSNELDGW